MAADALGLGGGTNGGRTGLHGSHGRADGASGRQGDPAPDGVYRISLSGRRSGKSAVLTAIAENLREHGWRIEERDGYAVGWPPETNESEDR